MRSKCDFRTNDSQCRSFFQHFRQRVGPGLRKFVILRHDSFGSDSKPMELQIFSQLIVDSWFILVLISFCNMFMADLVSGFCVLLYSRLSLHFSLMRSKMA